MRHPDPLNLVIAAVGSKAALAKQLQVTRGAVTHWKTRIPISRVVEIERITGISRTILRPDVFGDVEITVKVTTKEPA